MKMIDLNKSINKNQNQNVNHPNHYNVGKYQVIDVIDDWQLDFSLGNAIKYIARAGIKSKETEIEDLNKAIWYIKHKIKTIKEGEQK